MVAALSKLVRLLRGLTKSPARLTWILFSGRSPILDGPLYEAKINEFIQQIEWDAFVRDTGGDWTTTRRVTIRGPWGCTTLRVGQTVMSGQAYAGLNLFALLERGAKVE